MDVSSDSELELMDLIPDNILKISKVSTLRLIPEMSNEKYTVSYNMFMDWRSKNKTDSFSENVLLTYFDEMSKKFKPTTLWSQYSMIKTMLNVKNNVDIGNYGKLKLFLKRRSDGYKPKKSKVFTSEEITKFLKEAPDNEYLLSKVILIMGILGACRRDEIYKMKITDFDDLGTAAIAKVPKKRRKTAKKFTITGHFYDIFKKYKDLRPKNVTDSWFFCNYQNGKCTFPRVGINKIGTTGKRIAQYLKLPNPELYTGKCFRRSSATILDDVEEDMTSSKSQDECNSSAVPEDFTEESIKQEYESEEETKVFSSTEKTENFASTSKEKSFDHLENCSIETQSTGSCPTMIFNNCKNITFIIVNK